MFKEQLSVVGPLSSPLKLLVAPDDRALSISRLIADNHARAGAIDVTDPRVADAARRANVQVIDISKLGDTDAFNHNRFATLGVMRDQLGAESARGPRPDLGNPAPSSLPPSARPYPLRSPSLGVS